MERIRRNRSIPVIPQPETVEEPVIENNQIENVVQEEQEQDPRKNPIKWRKVGRGSFILNNRYIKPNQIFTATEDEIPKAFRDVVIPLETAPVSVDKYLTIVKESNYALQECEGTDFWNIVDKQGKIVNSNPLTYQNAISLLSSL